MPTAAFIDEHADELVAFCAHLVQQASPNPPGDTRAVAAAVGGLLERHGIPVETIADQESMPNLVASIEGREPGPHLVLNGHMDVYPDGAEAAWSRPPRSGAIEGGRLHGRGAGDMKSGLTTLLYAFLALAADRSFAGRLSLCAVSDEMSFSPHGAPLVLTRRPDLVGDAAIGAEPTSPDFVLIGEKGMLWIEVTTLGDAGAGAFASGLTNAIETMGAVIADLAAWRERDVSIPPTVTAALAAGGTAGLPDEALTYADDRVLHLPTVSVGTIRGGTKINLVAETCRAEVDLRIPAGLTLDDARSFVAEVIARHVGATSLEIQGMEPNLTDPSDPLVQALLDAGGDVLGVRPRPELGITASDTRLWRALGRPAAMIGPRIAGQGMPDESIAVADLIACAKIVALAAKRYLQPSPGRTKPVS